MLKFIKNLSMLSTTHDSLQNAGAVERLIDLLRTVGLRDTSTRDVANQILNIMYNLCRLSKQTQEFAAKQGIIPLLMKAGESGWAVREFALPIICDMAHSGKSGRKNLWSNNGLHFYVRLLADKNWQTTALDAIFVW